MSFPELFTAAERRLSLLLFLLAVIGLLVRVGRGVSPEVAAWLDAPDGGAAETTRTAATIDRLPNPTPLETRSSRSETPAGRVDPNHATREELMTLPGIGPALAGRILADREQNGPYRRARDLLRISGIGPATLSRIAPYLSLP
jgi:competence ComEA-like helix-hairpin-helix protein